MVQQHWQPSIFPSVAVYFQVLIKKKRSFRISTPFSCYALSQICHNNSPTDWGVWIWLTSDHERGKSRKEHITNRRTVHGRGKLESTFARSTKMRERSDHYIGVRGGDKNLTRPADTGFQNKSNISGYNICSSLGLTRKLQATASFTADPLVGDRKEFVSSNPWHTSEHVVRDILEVSVSLYCETSGTDCSWRKT